MDFLYADNENSTLIYHAGVSCLTHYESNGSSSTPGKARDGFVNNWGINSDADVKWRISHLSNWQTMLEDELDLGRPILYSGGALFGGGHSWVIDGYDADGNFYCNWGWYGDYNEGTYSLGDFDPGGNGPFNQYESAIFNVEPVELAGVGIPQIIPKTVTYNPIGGYALSIPSVYGATNYEWITDRGTISGGGTSITLFSNCNSIVQVRAFNSICNIYSPYMSALISIDYGPITGSSLVCSAGATFTVNNVPTGSNVTWTCSANLTFDHQPGNPKLFTATGNGTGTVTPTINLTTCGSVTLPAYNVLVGTQKPGPISIDFDAPPGRFTASIDAVPTATSYKWYCDGVLTYANGTTIAKFVRDISNCGHVYYVDVASVNTCGVSEVSHGEVSEPPCEYLVITPNPGTDNVQVTISSPASRTSTSVSSANMSSVSSTSDVIPTYTVRIFDSFGLLYGTFTKTDDSFTVPVNNLKEGTYIVTVGNTIKNYSGKLIIKR